MRLSDVLAEVWQDLRKQRLRSALTLSGIAIGAFTIGVMVGLGQGLHGYLEAQARAVRSPNTLRVSPRRMDFLELALERLSSLGRPAREIRPADKDIQELLRGTRRDLNRKDLDALRAIPGVVSVSPRVWLRADSIALDDDPREYFVDVLVRLSDDPIDIAAGRLFLPDATDEVVLSWQYLEAFGFGQPEDLLGKQVRIKVTTAKAARKMIFGSPATDGEDYRTFDATVVGLSVKTIVGTAAYLPEPLGIAMARYQTGERDLFSPRKFGSQALVRVASAEEIDRVREEIDKLGLHARNTDDDVATLTKIFVVVDSFLASFGALALAVASLGIANTLVMSIYERTREIGIMKALGATEGTIRLIFAAEAATIGWLGGVLGTAVAFGLGQAANQVAMRTFAREWGGYRLFEFPWWLLLGAVAIATLIGAVAGLLPANRAARLDPIQALRYE